MPRIVRRLIEQITITTWTVTVDEAAPPAPPAEPAPAQLEATPAAPGEAQAQATPTRDSGKQDRSDP